MTRFIAGARQRGRIGLTVASVAAVPAVAAAALSVAFGIGRTPAGAVEAQSGQALSVGVTGVSNTVSPDGVTCVWTVTSDVAAVALTSDGLTYSDVAASVSWTDPTGSGVDTEVTITDHGTPPLATGDSLGAGARQTYDGFTVQFSTPCAATTGDLAIGITTQDGFGSGDNHFLGNGPTLPIGWLGALGRMSAVRLTLIIVAAAAILAALIWRIVRSRKFTARLHVLLRSQEPAMRQAGLAMLAQHTLGPYLATLKEMSESELDPAVQDVLAEVIARHQWEPTEDMVVVELRGWAQRHARRSPVTAGHATAAQLAAGDDPRTTVMVTGAGGPAGVGVIRWLGRHGYRVVAVDASRSAVGLSFADASAVVPSADDPEFVAELAAVGSRAGAEVLIATVTDELPPIGLETSRLEAASIAAWVPDAAAVASCTDKWLFHQVASAAGIGLPPTSLSLEEPVPGPWIVKPRFGRGSRDIHRAGDVGELRWAFGRVPDPIVQTRLDGDEFAVDVLIDRDGSLAGAVPRWRIETRGGISTIGVTFENDQLVTEVGRLVAALGLHGPANVRGFVGPGGTIDFTDVNPRFSAGLPLSLEAGADLIGQYIAAAQGESIDRSRLSYRRGLKMMRYFEEVFVAEPRRSAC